MTTQQESKKPQDRPFDPFRIARTDTAKAVVADVLNQLQNYELCFKIRQRARRKDDQTTFERIVETLVCDLVHRELTQPEGWVAIPLSKQVLSREDPYRSPVLSKTLPEVIKRMASPEMSFIEFKKGYHDHPFKPTERNKQSVIRAGKKLLTRIRDHGLSFSDLATAKDEEVIILRDKASTSHKNQDMKYDDIEQTRQYREQVQRINAWLEQADIWFDHGESTMHVDPQDRRLRRIFNNGSFEQGGRLFGGFWQPLKNHQRLSSIHINEQRVASLDFGQMAARILYGMAGATPHFDDAYLLPGWEKHRTSVKTMFNAMLHGTQRHTRFAEGSRGQLPKTIKVDDIINAITTYHAPIKGYFYSGQGMEVMFKESQIMVDILLKLMDKDIVALPIHDAIIVSKGDVHRAQGIMLDVFREHTGVEGQVEVEYGS